MGVRNLEFRRSTLDRGPTPITRCAMTIVPSWQTLGPELAGWGGPKDPENRVCLVDSEDSRCPKWTGYL